jgi:hypothetical protein
MNRHSHPTFPVSNDSRPVEPTESGGMGWEYVPRAVRPNIPVRQPVPLTKDDLDAKPMKFIALALTQLERQFRRVAIGIEDQSMPVDNYSPQTLPGVTTGLVNLQPQYESGEHITSVIVTGPAGAVTVTLGDRIWPLTIPATGILVIAPISIFLGRDDTRSLASVTPGQYNLNLCGYADTRGVGP